MMWRVIEWLEAMTCPVVGHSWEGDPTSVEVCVRRACRGRTARGPGVR